MKGINMTSTQYPTDLTNAQWENLLLSQVHLPGQNLRQTKAFQLLCWEESEKRNAFFLVKPSSDN